MAFPKDEELYAALSRGGIHESAAISRIYEHYRPMVINYILRNSGTVPLAEDIFQEAILVFVANFHSGQFRREGKASAYILSTARLMWLNQLKQNDRLEIDRDAAFERIPAEEIELPGHPCLDAEREQLVQHLIGMLGKACRDLLGLRFWYRMSMKEIAKRLAYKNEAVVKTKHQKCLGAIRSLLETKPELRKALREVMK